MNYIVATLFVIFVVCSLGYYGHAKSECDAHGGVLVRKATGFYACAKELK